MISSQAHVYGSVLFGHLIQDQIAGFPPFRALFYPCVLLLPRLYFFKLASEHAVFVPVHVANDVIALQVSLGKRCPAMRARVVACEQPAAQPTDEDFGAADSE